MRTYCGYKRALLPGLVLAVGIAVCIFPARTAAFCITVEAKEPDRIVASLPLQPGEVFYLQFINSIYREPVKETYRYDPDPSGSIVSILVESPSAAVFEYYGLIPDGSGKATVCTRVKEIRVRSHDYRNHRLSTGTRTLVLKGLVLDGEPLIIRVREDGRYGRLTTGSAESR
jgi:hypothetical protein